MMIKEQTIIDGMGKCTAPRPLTAAFAVATLAVVFALAILDCSSETTDDANGSASMVKLCDLSGLVTTPVKDNAPDTRSINTVEYTGQVQWQTADGEIFTGEMFAPMTVYKAALTLVAKAGYTFTGLGVSAFVYDYPGVTVIHIPDSGIVTIVFPQTDEPDSTAIITGLERFNGKYAYSYSYLENGGYVFGYSYKINNNDGIYVSKIKDGVVYMALFTDYYGRSPYTGSDQIREYVIVIVDDPDGDGFYTGTTGGAPWDTGTGSIRVPCYRGVSMNWGQVFYFNNGKIKLNWADL